jgi:hypothetical protein
MWVTPNSPFRAKFRVVEGYFEVSHSAEFDGIHC